MDRGKSCSMKIKDFIRLPSSDHIVKVDDKMDSPSFMGPLISDPARWPGLSRMYFSRDVLQEGILSNIHVVTGL